MKKNGFCGEYLGKGKAKTNDAKGNIIQTASKNLFNDSKSFCTIVPIEKGLIKVNLLLHIIILIFSIIKFVV